MALLFQCSLKNMRAIETRDIRLHSADLVGQDGILRAGWQPALGGHLQTPAGGLATRRRLPTCPTSRRLSSPYFASLNSLFLSLPFSASPRLCGEISISHPQIPL